MATNTSTFTVVSPGRGRNQNSNGDYATCRNASSASDVTADEGVIQAAAAYSILRYYAPFNLLSPTSGLPIPSGAQIVSAFIRLPGVATDFSNGDSDSIAIVASTQASPTALVQDDFDQVGSTAFGTLALASYNTGGNNDITINASGLSNIQGGGYAKFAARMNTRDLGNSAPAGNNTVRFTTSGVLLSVTWNDPITDDASYFM